MFSMLVSYGDAAAFGPETAGSWMLDSGYPTGASGGWVDMNGTLGDAWVHDSCQETVCLRLNVSPS